MGSADYADTGDKTSPGARVHQYGGNRTIADERGASTDNLFENVSDLHGDRQEQKDDRRSDERDIPVDKPESEAS